MVYSEVLWNIADTKSLNQGVLLCTCQPHNQHKYCIFSLNRVMFVFSGVTIL